MNIVLSTDEIKWVRKGLPEYKKSCIIDSRDIRLNLGYKEGDQITNITHKHIINAEIEKLLLKAINSKRINQIVYFNFEITNSLIENLTNFLIEKEIEEKDIKLILFDKDESNVPLWTIFDEILS